MKTYFKFACIYCGQHMECKPSFCGCQILCPTCTHRIVIPSEQAGLSPRQHALAPGTWDTSVPTPSVEVPTRHRHHGVTNLVLD